MTSFLRFFGVILVLLALVAAPAAEAAKNKGKKGKHKRKAHTEQHDKHGDDHGDAHGDDHGDDHGGGHHYDYTADEDGDGTPNWRDPVHFEKPNDHYVVSDLAFHAFNLFVVFGLIGYAARQPIADSLRERALLIRKELTDTARERDEARQKYDELEARLGAFEDELKSMREEAENQAKVEEAKLVERASTEAERIAVAAEHSIRDELTRARTALRAEAVELAVELARNALVEQVNSDDQKRLAREFLDSLGEDASDV